MSRPSNDLRDLAGLYALDALDPEQTRRFEAFMATSPDTQREVAEFRAAAANLAAAEATAPPAALRDAVLAEVAVTRQEAPAIVALPSRPRRGVLAAAALVMVVALGVVLLTVRGGDTDQVADVLAAPDAVTVLLDGPATPDLSVVWSADLDRVAVVPGETPQLDDEVYVLWNLPDVGDPQRLVAFDASDAVLVDTTGLFTEPGALAVSIETDAASMSPTEPIVAGPARVDA